MEIGSGAQALVIQTRQAQCLFQILLEIMQSFELRRLSGHAMRGRCFPKHLVAAVYQEADFVAYYQTGFADVRVLAGLVVNGCANAVTADHRTLGVHESYYESKW